MNSFKKISDEDIKYFNQKIGELNVYIDIETLTRNAKDYTEDLIYIPEVVLKPILTQEISEILRYCNANKIPVTVRGAGTGLSGGSLPIFGGVILNMERFNKIINIDKENLQATVEPGVINETFQQAVGELGLFYPPDPASKGSCFLGGNIAHSSGGPKALKYGTTKDYVLNLEVVLANGEIIETGANVLKNSTGYNLTQLMIGSEGTLGVVTKIVFRLIHKPLETFLMLAKYKTNELACKHVSKIFNHGFNPSACELMTINAFNSALHYLNLNFDIDTSISCLLLIELDGNNIQTLQEEGYTLAEFLTNEGCDDILFFDSFDQKEHIWKIRRSIGESAKHKNIYKEEDTVIPRASLPLLLEKLSTIETLYGFRTITYGHAGDGNLHINILKDMLTDEYWENEIPKAINQIFEYCVELKGTISGEHGIGFVQKKYIPIALNSTHITLMKGIKDVFDPKGILNPSKIFPD
jgi:glycolate oxidase